MDVSDAPASSGVMIAFLPTTSAWCNQELPHMTLVYAGTVENRSPSDYNSLAKDAASIAMLTRPFAAEVEKVDIFGDDEKVNVLKFRMTPELKALRSYVYRWNQSEYPFNPHATIGPVNDGLGPVPEVVYFDRIMVGWGEDSMTFNLNTKY